MHLLNFGSPGLSSAPLALPRMIGTSSPGKVVLGQQFADFHLDQLEQLGVVDQVALVEEDDQSGHVDLPGQQDVLASLRHRTVGRRNDEDRPVHLGRAGNHVLDVVGVTRTVDVSVVTLGRLVFDVADGDCDGLGFVADRPALGDIRVRLDAGQTLGRLNREDRGRQSGLAVIDVTDRTNIHVRLGTFKNCLGHVSSFSLSSTCLRL